MKNTATLIILILLILSCKSNGGKIEKVEKTDARSNDTIISSKPIENKSLKNCIINESYFHKKIKLATPLKNKEIELLNLNIIESVKSDPFAKIKIIDTLFINQQIKILVVSQESENENAAFIVQLDSKNKVLNFETVFYTDNVEYISSTSTNVANKTIEIITETDIEKGKPVKEIVTLKFINGKIIK